MNRIQSGMNTFEMISALSGNHLQSMRALKLMVAATKQIDPQLMAPHLCLRHADDLGLHDELPFVLYGIICGKDEKKMAAVVRAGQLGQISGECLTKNLRLAADRRAHELDVDALARIVQNNIEGYEQLVPFRVERNMQPRGQIVLFKR